MTVIKTKIEKRPYPFEFTKADVVGRHPTMANLNYDPFPRKNMHDVVRCEILCTELVLHATLKGDETLSCRPGHSIAIEGHTFAITSAEIDMGEMGGGTAEIEGSKFLGECDPIKVLAKWREMLAASNTR
jgi:hypothetical protein